MSELAAQAPRAQRRRAPRCSAAARFERAEELAAALGGQAAPFESLRDELARADIVISGTGAPGIVIHREDVESARAARRGAARPLFLIDIAVPRDIDPAVRKLDGRLPLRPRRPEGGGGSEPARAPQGSGGRGGPGRARGARVPGLAEARSTSCPSSSSCAGAARRSAATRSTRPEARSARSRRSRSEALEAATTAIVNKLLHPPTVHAEGDGPRTATPPSSSSLIRKLLGLVSRMRIRIGTRGSPSPSGRPSTSRRASRRSATRSSSTSSRPPATGSRPAARERRGQGRLPEGDRGGDAGRRGRPRRAQPEGRAHRVARGPLALCAILERADPRDALLSAGNRLDRCPGARVGTTSLRRRRSSCAARGPTWLLDLRGNVDTRIRRLRERRLRRDPPGDGRPLAARTGRRGHGGARSGRFVPAPGQGAIALECREGDEATRRRSPLHHEPTARAVTAERALLAALGGGCNVPLGAFAPRGSRGPAARGLRGRCRRKPARARRAARAESPRIWAAPVAARIAGAPAWPDEPSAVSPAEGRRARPAA